MKGAAEVLSNTLLNLDSRILFQLHVGRLHKISLLQTRIIQ